MQPYEPRPQGLLGIQNGGPVQQASPDRHFECREDPGDEVHKAALGIKATFKIQMNLHQLVEYG